MQCHCNTAKIDNNGYCYCYSYYYYVRCCATFEGGGVGDTVTSRVPDQAYARGVLGRGHGHRLVPWQVDRGVLVLHLRVGRGALHSKSAVTLA